MFTSCHLGMNNPSNALRQEACQETLPSFSFPFLASILTCLLLLTLGPGLSILSVLCLALLFQPGSQLVWEMREVQSRKIDVVTGFPRDCKWGEARMHPLAHSPCLFSFCALMEMTHAAALWASPTASVTL